MTCKVVYSKETEWDVPWITEKMDGITPHSVVWGWRFGPFQLRSPIQIQIITLKRWQMPWNWQRKSCPRPVDPEHVVNNFIGTRNIGVSEMMYFVKESPLLLYIYRNSYKIYKLSPHQVSMMDDNPWIQQVDAVGGSATGTLGANNEATWCDIFPNVPPPVALAACGDRTSRGEGGNFAMFRQEIESFRCTNRR